MLQRLATARGESVPVKRFPNIRQEEGKEYEGIADLALFHSRDPSLLEHPCKKFDVTSSSFEKLSARACLSGRDLAIAAGCQASLVHRDAQAVSMLAEIQADGSVLAMPGQEVMGAGVVVPDRGPPLPVEEEPSVTKDDAVERAIPTISDVVELEEELQADNTVEEQEKEQQAEEEEEEEEEEETTQDTPLSDANGDVNPPPSTSE
jgi:hypothetical protein